MLPFLVTNCSFAKGFSLVFVVKGFLRVVGGKWGTKAVASLDRIRKSEAQNWLRWFRLSISLDIAS